MSAAVSSEVELDVKNSGRENSMYLHLVLSDQVMCNTARWIIVDVYYRREKSNNKKKIDF